MIIPKLPIELTNAGWQKNKGLLAKVGAPATGLGKMLDDVEARYKAINWGVLMFKVPDHATPDQIKVLYGPYEKERSKMEALLKAYDVAEMKAKETAALWGKHAAIPAAATKAALTVATQASMAKSDVKKLFDAVAHEQKDHLNKGKAIEKRGGDHASRLTKATDNIRKARKVTFVDWPKFWKEHVAQAGSAMRDLSAMFPDARRDYDRWKPFYPKMPMPKDEQMLDKMMKSLADLSSDSGKLLRKLGL